MFGLFFFIFTSKMISEKLKAGRYERIYSQISELLQKSPGFDSRLATINAVLYHKVSYIFWVGFYLLQNNRLCVSSYQGPLACQELEYPKGVCWHSIIHSKSVIVPDVSQFPDHITCDSRSKSEIVVPLISAQQEIIGVLDVDSDEAEAFDKVDEIWLKRITGLVFQ